MASPGDDKPLTRGPYQKPWSERTVLPEHLAGGPQNLGDPESRHLRLLERDNLIPEIMRKLTMKEKCVDEVKNMEKCWRANNNLLITHHCKDVMNALNKCRQGWFFNEDFRKEVTENYLRDRAEYRRTGLPPGIREEAKRRVRVEREDQQDSTSGG